MLEAHNALMIFALQMVWPITPSNLHALLLGSLVMMRAKYLVDYGLLLNCPLLLCVSLDLPKFQLPLPVGDWAAIQYNHHVSRQLDYHPT